MLIIMNVKIKARVRMIGEHESYKKGTEYQWHGLSCFSVVFSVEVGVEECKRS